MLLPQGELVGVEVGNPFKVKIPKEGYLLVSWEGGSARGVVFIKNGKPSSFIVELFEEGKTLKGKEAEEVLRGLNDAVIEIYKANVEVQEEVNLTSGEGEEYLHEVIFEKDWTNFTGVVECIGENRMGIVQFIDGKIAGVRIILDGEEFEGESALFYADQIKGKVIIKEGEITLDQGFRKLPTLQTPDIDEEELRRRIKEAEEEINAMLQKIKKGRL